MIKFFNIRNDKCWDYFHVEIIWQVLWMHMNQEPKSKNCCIFMQEKHRIPSSRGFEWNEKENINFLRRNSIDSNNKKGEQENEKHSNVNIDLL